VQRARDARLPGLDPVADRRVRDEAADALHAAHEALTGERRQGLAHREAVHAVRLREDRLRRKPPARGHRARADVPGEVAGDLRVQGLRRGAPDRRGSEREGETRVRGHSKIHHPC